jgi:hypothetical protein
VSTYRIFIEDEERWKACAHAVNANTAKIDKDAFPCMSSESSLLSGKVPAHPIMMRKKKSMSGM